MRRTRSFVAAAVCAGAVAALGAAPAVAGEITGSGKWIAGTEQAPLHGKSECAYSGLNDAYVLGEPVPDADGFTRTQSWGQLPKEVRDLIGQFGAHPGDSCNPAEAGGAE